ncbi:glycosyltransferase family 2 protein [Rubrivirga sp.]|uniref:glycosyltransferase family 2 protein n=1 Tax=Rubrivirga sp. TaxID=1885344 RepID=UPI003B52C31A
MSEPTLALCIPAYNAAWCLPRLLESAAAQTVPFDEVVVYDDCSPDDQVAVAERFGARVVRGEVNVGCSAGKNRLAEATDCDWVHFHDADDELKPMFVEEAWKWMALGDEAPDVVLFSYEERDNETGSPIDTRRFDDAALRADPVAYTIREQVNPFCGIYRRSAFLAVGGYDLDPDVLYNEDVAFHCRMARAGLSFRADPAVTVINHRVMNSMSQANGAKCVRAQYHVMRKAAEHALPQHQPLVAGRLWEIAGVAGSYLDWGTADAALRLARQLGGPVPGAGAGSAAFRAVATVAPRSALRFRERVVRALRPQLRTSNG